MGENKNGLGQFHVNKFFGDFRKTFCGIAKTLKLKKWEILLKLRLDSNTDSVTLNNTY